MCKCKWQSIETAPQDGRTLLLGYFNSAGKWRTTRGQWISQDYIDEYAEDPDFMSPGWHETTVEDDDGKCWPIDPTHWIPTPLPPTSAEGAPQPSPVAQGDAMDSGRLDWLALAGPVQICLVIDREHDGDVEVSTDDVAGYGKTLRAAIDDARATQESKK